MHWEEGDVLVGCRGIVGSMVSVGTEPPTELAGVCAEGCCETRAVDVRLVAKHNTCFSVCVC